MVAGFLGMFAAAQLDGTASFENGTFILEIALGWLGGVSLCVGATLMLIACVRRNLKNLSRFLSATSASASLIQSSAIASPCLSIKRIGRCFSLLATLRSLSSEHVCVDPGHLQQAC